MSFFDKVKKAGKSMVDGGAKAMLKVKTRLNFESCIIVPNVSIPKGCFLTSFLSLPLQTDIAFLSREIKNRKQKFGVEVYELMEQLEVNNDLTVEEKETKIRLAFDMARKDIAIIQAKIEVKKDEIGETDDKPSSNFPTGTTQQMGTNHIMTTAHPGDNTEMEHGM